MPQLLDSDAREDDPRLAEVADIMAAMAEQGPLATQQGPG
jgi:hypothetical protein